MINYDITLWIYVYINIRTLAHSMLPSAISHSVSSYTHTHVHTYFSFAAIHTWLFVLQHHIIVYSRVLDTQNRTRLNQHFSFHLERNVETNNNKEKKKTRHHPHENEKETIPNSYPQYNNPVPSANLYQI